MRILIFGVGKYYQNRKDKIPKGVEIIAFLDNNSELHGEFFDGKIVYSPNDILTLNYDKVVLMSGDSRNMRSQLLNIGVDESSILFWDAFLAMVNGNKHIIYSPKVGKELVDRGKVLIVSTALNYDGGSLAAVYAAMALKERNFFVEIAAPSGNSILIQEIVSKGISVDIWAKLPYIEIQDLEYVQRFNVVLVNVFQMIQCACEIIKKKPVLWWIHENSNRHSALYIQTQNEFEKYDHIEKMSRINIVAVSEMAKNVFNTHYRNRISNVLTFGIPDSRKATNKTEGKITFALIGTIMPRKAQHILIEAIRQLPMNERMRAEFLFIGRKINQTYWKELIRLSAGIREISFLGEKNREDMHTLYQTIDVVVCASLEETMSITIVEGMMYGKLCITTDATGIADYIRDGKNGFVCKVNDAEALRDKMSYVIRNKDHLDNIGMNARKTYEEYFTLEAFGERLEAAIEDTRREYKHDKVFSNYPGI